MQKVVLKKVKTQHVLNGRTDFFITIIEGLRVVPNCYINQHPSYESTEEC